MWQFTTPPPAELAQRRRLLDAYGQWAQLSVLLLPLLFQLSRGLQLLAGRLCRARGMWKTGYMPVDGIDLDPGHSGSDLGHSGSDPDHSGSTPGHFGSDPDHFEDEVDSDHSEIDPDHFGSDSGHSEIDGGSKRTNLGKDHSNDPSGDMYSPVSKGTVAVFRGINTSRELESASIGDQTSRKTIAAPCRSSTVREPDPSSKRDHFSRWNNCPNALTAGWTVWLLVLVVSDTRNDYLHLTKRFGIVAASQLPLHYLLAAKGWTPVQYLAQMGPEQLNVYHRRLGRLIFALMVGHALLYLNFYVQKGLLTKRIRDPDVQLGLLAITSATLLFTTATVWLRNRSYRTFFYTHVVLSALLLPVLFLHVSHIRIYILESLLVYAGIVVQRNWNQTTVHATITRIPQTNLLSVVIPLNSTLRRKSFVPGQHVYLSFPQLQHKLRLNPFSIANLPLQEDKIQLILRRMQGTTSLLDSCADQPLNLLLEGPYGTTKYFPPLPRRILLVAGGVGATFTLPFYRPGVKFVWVVRTEQETSWAPIDKSMDIYITRKGTGRPNFGRIIDETFGTSSEKTAALVCGPPGMAEAVQRPLEAWARRTGGQYFWHSEAFSL